MSDLKNQDAVKDFFAHHGVKGMRWGVRRSKSGRVQLGAAPRRASANRKAARQAHAEKTDQRRQARVDKIIKNAGGNKTRAQLTNLGSGVVASLLTGYATRTAVSVLSASNPNVAEGAKVVGSLMQLGITATTAVNAVRISNS